MSGEDKRTVPYERFQEVVNDRNTLRDENGTLKGEIQTLTEKAATADTLGSELSTLRSTLQSKETAWAEERTLLRTFDDEGLVAARALHGQLAEEGRPSLPDWISGLKSDPTKAPKLLRSYFEAGTDTDTDTDVDKTKTKHDPDKDTKPDPKPPKQLDASAVKAMREKARKTGDWSEYDKYRKSLGFGR